jgi:hypothetical protein
MRTVTALTAALLAFSGCRTTGNTAGVKDAADDGSTPSDSDTPEAGAAAIASCNTDDGATSVVVSKASSGLTAKVTTESTGGSTPSFRYKVTQNSPTGTGGGQTFTGNNFSLHINTDGPTNSDGTYHSQLTVNDLHIKTNIGCSYTPTANLGTPAQPGAKLGQPCGGPGGAACMHGLVCVHDIPTEVTFPGTCQPPGPGLEGMPADQ